MLFMSLMGLLLSVHYYFENNYECEDIPRASFLNADIHDESWNMPNSTFAHLIKWSYEGLPTIYQCKTRWINKQI